MANTLIRYDGALVAIASSLRVHFTPPLDGRPEDDPVRRFVLAMAVFARDVGAGHVPGPYDQEAAELYARALLIDDKEFTAAAASSTDEQLSERFNVPLEQIARKRADLDRDAQR